MTKLQKRSDVIYKDIESFKDYELTQCVAYEMAIRNDENFISFEKYISDSIMFYNKYQEGINRYVTQDYKDLDTPDDNTKLAISDMLATKGNQISVKQYLANENHKHKEKMSDEDKLVYEILLEKIHNINIEFFQEDGTVVEFNSIKKYGRKFYNLLELISKHNKVKTLYINEIDNKVGYSIVHGVYTNDEDIGFTINTDKDKKNYFKDEYEAFGEEYNFNITANSRIIENFKRPKIKIDNFKSKSLNLNIDLIRPEEEIIALIKHLKNDLKKHQLILKAPIELLNEKLLEADDIPRNKPKRWADIFFIYDYVKAKKNEIKVYNENVKKDHDERVYEVKQNIYSDSYDKKIQIIELEKEFNKNKDNKKVVTIFYEDELLKQIKISGDSTKALYYAIKPYIDDLKYKELISGVSIN